MTLEHLEQNFLNGLHDAQIKAMTHDYEHAIVRLDVQIVVGMPEEDVANRLRYRSGKILFHQVLFCAVEVPENERILGRSGSIWFVFDRIKPEALPEKIARALPPEALCYSLYILEWESQIRIAAGDVSFSWSDSGEAHAAE
jgi:hypothetical protein